MSSLFKSALMHLVAVWYSTFDPPTAVTPLGEYTGHYKVSENGRLYEAHEGIPYAQPPVGDLRFKDPVPITESFDYRRTTETSSVCSQYNDVPPGKDGQPVLDGLIQGSEDCLYLNVYVPLRENRTDPMPIIFFIHGGSFQYGSGNLFGDKFLADRDLVFVTINYRLGALGFLSTEDEVVPGNLGLKDQSLALKWTSENGAYFRGDPTRLILAGFSAGSSSIQYHYLSPLSRGLFSGSIAMSGTAYNPWGWTAGAGHKARKLGALFNCTTSSSREMIDCLKAVPADDLVGATKHFQYWQYNPEAPWAPVVDSHSPRPFISQSAEEIFAKGLSYDVPAVYGMTRDEGCDPSAEYIPHENLLQELNDNWSTIAPHLLELEYRLPEEQQHEVSASARRHYFGDGRINATSAGRLTRLLTDQRYHRGFEDGIRSQARAGRSPVHIYYYTFRGSQSYSDHLSRTTDDYGVCHTDDSNLIVENPDEDPTKTDDEWRMSNFLMDMWVSIAYNNGVPDVGVDWPPMDPSDPELKYLVISGPGNYSMSGDSDFGQKSFWREYLPPPR